MTPVPPATWAQILETLLASRDLSEAQARWAMDQVMSGEAQPSQIAGFLVGLRGKGVSGAELAVLVDVMLAHSVPVTVPGITVDTCGTGGDNAGSANISTMAAVAVAACGELVVKHGNRASSSQAGSADVLEALGVVIGLPAPAVSESVARVGIGFCFAPVFHPAMRFAGPVRRDLGIRSVFNVLGPLANPARPAAQVVGVADLAMAPIVAEALAQRGTAALVVRGEDGLDEITTADLTRVWDCRGGEVRETVIDTVALGMPRARLGALVGGDATRNAEIARAVLAPRCPEDLVAIRDAVVVNAAAALVAAESARTGRAGDLVVELADQVARVSAAVTDGAASEILENWVAVTAELAGPAE